MRKNPYPEGRKEQRRQVRQTAAGLDRLDADLVHQRQRLLEERRKFTTQNVDEQLPSPKFNDPKNHSRQNKVKQLQRLLNQIVSDSGHESAEVQRGLMNLREIHMRILRGMEDGRAARHRSPSNEPTSKPSIPKRFRELKYIIDRLVQESNIESQEVRLSLNKLKNLQDEMDVEMADPCQAGDAFQTHARPDYGRFDSFDDHQMKQQREQQIRELAPELLLTENGTDRPSNITQQISQAPNLYDQLDNLDDIQGRLFEQILSLREDKLKLMNELNEQIKYSNNLCREMKKKPMRPRKDSQNETIINRLHHQDNTQVTKLREKVRRQQHEIDRLVDEARRPDRNREKAISKLQAALNNAHSHIEHLQRQNEQLLNRPTKSHNQSVNARLEEQNARMRARLEETEAQLDAIDQLKKENDDLRAETIQILRSKDSTVQHLQQQIANLKKRLSEEGQNRNRMADEVGGYIRRIRDQHDSYPRYDAFGF